MKSISFALFFLLAAGCYKSPYVVAIPDIRVDDENRGYEVFADQKERDLDASATEPAGAKK